MNQPNVKRANTVCLLVFDDGQDSSTFRIIIYQLYSNPDLILRILTCFVLSLFYLQNIAPKIKPITLS